ncbi:uncharacterized protein AAES06_005776 [Glossophaga mutica]
MIAPCSGGCSQQGDSSPAGKLGAAQDQDVMSEKRARGWPPAAAACLRTPHPSSLLVVLALMPSRREAPRTKTHASVGRGGEAELCGPEHTGNPNPSVWSGRKRSEPPPSGKLNMERAPPRLWSWRTGQCLEHSVKLK